MCYKKEHLIFGSIFVLFAAIVLFWLVPALKHVAIYPGTDIQTVVNQHPEGTTFLLKRGVHRLQSVTPKNGDTFIGEKRTTLSGAKLLADAG